MGLIPFSGQLFADKADATKPKESRNFSQDESKLNASLSQLPASNLFVDRKMEGKRCTTLSTYPESIDWNSFFET